jgi:tRNA(Ile)-lysidine synthase
MRAWPGSGVVAVSGGADSVALLRALCACGVPLTVAHVNHELRGADSDADESFVRELCGTLGVACVVKAADVAALAAGGNLESTARRVRYDFFAEVAAEVSAAWVATAHTADDQAETVLHRLVRGAGLQGLRGIASARRDPTPLASLAAPPQEGVAGGTLGSPSSEGEGRKAEVFSPPPPLGDGAGRWGSPTILRPLLTLTRADVLDYLASLNQLYREDASNADPRFTRNRVRHELLPLLRTFNPDIVSALTHIAEHASEAHDVLVVLAGELLARAERPRAANTIILDAATLAAAPRAVRRAALRLVWEREGWPVADMGFDAWDRAVEIAGGAAPACDFPAGVSMRRAARVVQLTRQH